MKHKFLVTVLVFMSVAIGVYYFSEKPAPILKAKVATGGPKRFVAWNKKQLQRQKGSQSINASTFTTFGAKNITQLENLNGYTFEADSDVELKLKAISISQNTDWVIQEEIEYTILPFQCSKCETIPCPGDTTPQPTPTPTPTPSPIEADKSWGRARVHAKEAMAIVDTSKVKVCVVDTGIDFQHPNKGNLIGTKDFTGKGSAQDGNGHGTHTAGTIGGTGGVGVARVATLVCKGLDDNGSGTSSGLAQCLNWCGQQGAQIVSNSWGSTQSDQLINQTITSLTSRGIYVMVANGNDSGPVNWPAKLAGSNPLVYAVAASNASDQITSFSSRGVETRAIAPGENIISNWPGGGTRSLSGTSMSTPHVAGICAFGIASGKKPCVKFSGTVGGYPMADALESAR